MNGGYWRNFLFSARDGSQLGTWFAVFGFELWKTEKTKLRRDRVEATPITMCSNNKQAEWSLMKTGKTGKDCVAQSDCCHTTSFSTNNAKHLYAPLLPLMLLHQLLLNTSPPCTYTTHNNK
jgi:hypothetical protein